MKSNRHKLQISGWFFFALLVVVLLPSCGTDDPERQAARDREKILEYLIDNNLTAIEHETGIFYHIDTLGAGLFPTRNSTVLLNYTGTLLDGNEFDKGFERTFHLPSAILGFQYGVPLFNRGASGFIIVPSGLAYGSTGTMTIGPNTILKFRVEVIDFRNN